MEARVKAELPEFAPSAECFTDTMCKVKVEPAVSLAASAVVGHSGARQRNVGIAHCVTQEQPKCRCRIDLSSPDTLERDFYAWLKGSEPASGTVPCLFASTSASLSEYVTEPRSQAATSFLTLDPLTDQKNAHQRWDVTNSGSSVSSDCQSSHCSVSPGNCSSAISSASCSSSSCASSSCCSSASSVAPFAPPSSLMPLPLHPSHPPNHQILHPFFHQHQYRLMVAPCVVDSFQQQHKHPLKVSSSSSLNATSAKIGPIPGTRMRRKRNVDKASGRGTNLYGRSYCPGRPLSMEERAQIIHLFHGGMKVNAISKQLCISHGCVSKIITRFRETGNLMPSSHSECRRRKRQQQQKQSQLTNGPAIG